MSNALSIWPQGQKIYPVEDPQIGITHFADCESYHPTLIRRLLELEQNSEYRHWIFKGGGGVKVNYIDRWNIPEATLLYERAIAMFRTMLKVDDATVDDSWCSISRKGDYCIPHSHLRTQASLVYLLDPGDFDPEDPAAGRFCIADPRIKACCKHEPGRVTAVLMPDMRPGSLIMFPSSVVHYVNPYIGKRPRITLSMNISTRSVPGKPTEGWEDKMPKKQ